jgi:hypothetical protein
MQRVDEADAVIRGGGVKGLAQNSAEVLPPRASRA